MSSRCDACGGTLVPALDEVVDPQTSEHFRVERCHECGLGHTLPVPTDLSPYYGPSYHGGRHGLTARLCHARRMRWLQAATGRGREGQSSGRRLLDVGCGEGGFLLAARAAGWHPFGTELRVEPARRAGLEVESSLRAVSRHGPFHAVTFWHSLEHLRSPREALAQVHEMLVPGGQLLIAVPDAGGLQARAFGPEWFHLDVPRHLFHFDQRSLERLLERQGFPVQRWWCGELEYDVMGWAQSALNRWTRRLPRNHFFQWTMGRTQVRSYPHLMLGALASATGLPLTLLSMAARRAGTLIVSAVKSGVPSQA